MRKKMISNISNTMTDRAGVNHSCVELLKKTWHKNLTEFNCHLHPLDTISSTCRTALKQKETKKGALFGNDCLAGNIVLAINKLR